MGFVRWLQTGSDASLNHLWSTSMTDNALHPQQPPARAPVRLTPRERQVLLWCADSHDPFWPRVGTTEACGWSVRAEFEMTHELSPSGMPNPEVYLPSANGDLRKAALPGAGQASPVE